MKTKHMKLIIREKTDICKRQLRKRHVDYMLYRLRAYFNTKKKNRIIK